MSEGHIVRLREKLLRQRREIFETLGRFESDWQTLEERSPELEEEAQKVHLTSLFDQLDEFGKGEIEEIDLALYKMVSGSYGVCEACNEPISLKRLEALPATRLCLKCAQQYEEKQRKLPQIREVISSGEVPSDYRNLSDEELKMVILEHLRSDGRVDLEELEISCRNGVIYLDGTLPGESEHQILLRILTDLMGFTSVIDHLQTNELLWEREDRAPGRLLPGVSDEEDLLYDMDEVTDDVIESLEKEIPYVFPDRPQPEESDD